MTCESFRRFTCARCKAVVETAYTDQAPRWVRLTITEPPLANPSEADWDIHLCECCATAVHHLIGTPTYVEIPAEDPASASLRRIQAAMDECFEPDMGGVDWGGDKAIQRMAGKVFAALRQSPIRSGKP